MLLNHNSNEIPFQNRYFILLTHQSEKNTNHIQETICRLQFHGSSINKLYFSYWSKLTQDHLCDEMKLHLSKDVNETTLTKSFVKVNVHSH